ncbi:MAG: TlpA family protein disulfide reductase [Acidobacteria bacterium]|nr:TlpA family protein disulfide reductase [Acidobacteriota bacterium]
MKWLSTLLGGRTMSALTAGTMAPQFELPAIDGSRFSLQEALRRGPLLAIFFKISCPVCQYAFPYFQRIYQNYGSPKISIVGISQNDEEETGQFRSHYGVTFPVLLDDTKRFPVSNAYGLTNVPTAFWIAEDGEIEICSVGWVREDFEQMVQKAAAASGATPKPLFQASEQIADFRAG